MHKLLLFFFLITGSTVFAQNATITGRCVYKNGRAYEGAVISAAAYVNGKPGSRREFFADQDGRFTIEAALNDTVFLRFNNDGSTDRKIAVNAVNVNIGEVKFDIQYVEGVQVNHVVVNPFEIEPMKTIDLVQLPGTRGVEGYVILTAPGVVSNNELTSNYNVRGGNYDENLVYVNGFNVYRPFLTRSGQQEGMSFINSALVKNIRFSSGGFNSEYGDKLSSVLDIDYKTPDSLQGSVVASLLGVEGHIENEVNPRFNYLVGARYRSNGYLLNSLPAKGAYNPVFWDAQFLTNFAITEKLNWSVLGHFSSNNYRFAPQTQETDFGTANEAYSFRVYFEGQEETRFQTMMGGTSLNWQVNDNTKLDLYATVFNTDEREYFDILGQYFINQLETDPSKEEFGDSIAVLGIGSFLNHGRNRLNATIINVYHNGSHTLFKGYTDDERTKFRSRELKWGVNFQSDDFYDVLSEWKYVDSAGYSVPQNSPDQVVLFETIKGQLSLRSQRYTSFIQLNSRWKNNQVNLLVSVTKSFKDSLGRKYERTFTDTIRESASDWAFSIGSRAGYTSANDELFLTPRASVSFSPRVYMVRNDQVIRRQVNVRAATGLYYQPPFYREFRTFDGQLNLNVKSQKSFHFVTGTDVYFNMWDREVPFKFTAEAFYKYLWDVNPYEIENVRTRYYADNNAVAYAYGLDLNIFGEFVEGIESFFKVGVLSTKEDILNDSYKEFYNAAGERIIFGFSEDQTVVDSATIYPGYIPRPTDQLLTFGALIQDRMPKYESFSVQVGIQYGSSLPHGPPNTGLDRYKDTLRLKSYFRVDIGTSYDFLYKVKEEKNFWSRNFEDAILSFEVFNLLGINNVLSKQWVQDTQGKYYSIPNYLTQRRFNLKMILRF